MTKAEHYRQQHLELKNRKETGISWPKTVLESLGLMVAIAIIFVACIVLVPTV